eukprot:COSAG01_NODE_7828_length_3038_cov_1.237155_2_plen_66_part_00
MRVCHYGMTPVSSPALCMATIWLASALCVSPSATGEGHMPASGTKGEQGESSASAAAAETKRRYI